jgi:hypothetical protein
MRFCCRKERKVYGWLDNNTISGPCKGQSTEIKGRNNSGTKRDPFFINYPVMPDFEPVYYRLKIFGLTKRIAVNLMVKTFLKGFYNKIGCVKIHIRYPHRYNIIGTERLFPAVVLYAVCTFSSRRFIEIPHPKNDIDSGA